MDYFDKLPHPNYALDVQVMEGLLDNHRKTNENKEPRPGVQSENLLRAPEPFGPVRTPRKSFQGTSTSNVHTRNTSGFSGSNSSNQTHFNSSISSQGSVNQAATSHVEEYNSLARLNGLTELTAFYEEDDHARATTETAKSSSTRKIWRKIVRSSSSKNLEDNPEPRLTRKSSISSFLGKRPRLALNCQSLEQFYRLGGVSVVHLPPAYSAVSRAIPTCLAATANYLAENGKNTPGLFRIPGQISVVNGLYDHYIFQVHFAEKEPGRVHATVGSPAVPIEIVCSIHDVASAFKKFLWDLPGGILGSIPLFKALRQIEKLQMAEDQAQGDAYRFKVRLSALAIASLRSTRRIAVITAVLGLLALLKHDTNAQPNHNETTPSQPKAPDLMSSKALAVVFAPTLLGDLTDKIELQPSPAIKSQAKQTETPRRSFMHPFRTPKHTKSGSFDRTPDIEAGIERSNSAAAIIEFLLERWIDVVRHIQSLESQMGSHRSSRSIQDLARVDTSSPVWRSQRVSLEGAGMQFPPSAARRFSSGVVRHSSDSRGESMVAQSDTQPQVPRRDDAKPLTRTRSVSLNSNAQMGVNREQQLHKIASSAEIRPNDYIISHPSFARQRQMLSSRAVLNSAPTPPWWERVSPTSTSSQKKRSRLSGTQSQRSLVGQEKTREESLPHGDAEPQQLTHEEEPASEYIANETSKAYGKLEHADEDPAFTVQAPSPSTLCFSPAFSPPPQPLQSSPPPPPPPPPLLGDISGLDTQSVRHSRAKRRTRSVSLNDLDQPRSASGTFPVAINSADNYDSISNPNILSQHFEHSKLNQTPTAPVILPSSSSAATQQSMMTTTHPASQILEAFHQKQRRMHQVSADVSSDSSPTSRRVTPTKIPKPVQDLGRHAQTRQRLPVLRGGANAGTPYTDPPHDSRLVGVEMVRNKPRTTSSRRLGVRELTVPNLHDSDGRYPIQRRAPPPGLSLPGEPRFNRSASFMDGQVRCPVLAHPGSSAAAARKTEQQKQPIARRLVFRAPQGPRLVKGQDVVDRCRVRGTDQPGLGVVRRDEAADDDGGEDAFWQQHGYHHEPQHQHGKQHQQHQHQHQQGGSHPRARVSTLFDEIKRLKSELGACNEENRRLRREVYVLRANTGSTSGNGGRNKGERERESGTFIVG